MSKFEDVPAEVELTTASAFDVDKPNLNDESWSPRSSVIHHQQQQQQRKSKPLSLLPLVALIFYDVSGGPFGIEDAVSSGGPLLAVLGFLTLPLAWSVPEALVTAELATTFPENSGFVAWVTAAFGPFWGFQEGFWKWLSGVTDNAVYPVMFLTYLQQLVPILESGWPRTFFLVGLNLALTYLNYRGLHIVGNIALVMTGFTLLPFGIMSLLGLPHVKLANLGVVNWKTVKWVPFMNVMFWNLNYWDSVSTLAGEVENPKKTLPKALGIAVVLVVLSYLIPLLVGVGVASNVEEWQLGYFATIAEHVGGKWLAWWIVCAAAISQIGQFEAEMSSDSFQLQGMAERGFLPAVFSVRSKHGTPTMAIIFSSFGIMTMASFNFLEIVELLNIVYCMAELLEFLAFIWLRYKYSDLVRPYRIPLSNFGCICMLIPAFILLSGMLLVPMIQGDVKVILFTVTACIFGVVLYPLLQLARQRGWAKYCDVSPMEFRDNLHTSASAASLGADAEALLVSK
jgi:amino acid transporter